MGDEAETVFETVADTLGLRYVRYGLNRPPLQVGALPQRIRYTPDYLTTKAFVEVQGYGRDQELKLKVEKWMALHHWHSILPVELFVWDRTHQRWAFVTLPQLDVLLVDGDAAISKFPEGKTYLSFNGSEVFEVSDRVGEHALQA